MKKYLFEDKYLGVSENHLHFLRDRFEYKKIEISEVDEVILKMGKAIKNWMLLMILGGILLFGGFYFGSGVIQYFGIDDAGKGNIDILEMIFPIFLIFIGGYFIYESLKKEKILEFKIGKKLSKFSIKEFENQNQLDSLLLHLSNKTKLIDKS